MLPTGIKFLVLLLSWSLGPVQGKIPPFDSDAVLIQLNLIQLKQIKCAGQLSAQLLDKFIQKTL